MSNKTVESSTALPIIFLSTTSTFIETTTTAPTMETTIIQIMQSISIKAGYTLAATSLSFFVFLISEFLLKSSKHKSPYFAIYAITLLEPVSTVSAFLLRIYIFPGVNFFDILNEFVWWYIRIFSPFANLLLAINRFTAVIFYMQYQRWWSKKHLYFIITLLFLYPFIVNGYSWIRLECRFYVIDCPNYMYGVFDFAAVHMVSLATISGTLGTIAVIRKLFKQSKNNKIMIKKIEVVVMIQSVAVSFAFIFESIYFKFFIQTVFADPPSAVFYGSVAELGWIGYHFVGIFVLFILSSSFRTAYLSFYKLNYIFRCCGCQKQNAVTITATTSTNFSSNRN